MIQCNIWFKTNSRIFIQNDIPKRFAKAIDEAINAFMERRFDVFVGEKDCNELGKPLTEVLAVGDFVR